MCEKAAMLHGNQRAAPFSILLLGILYIYLCRVLAYTAYCFSDPTLSPYFCLTSIPVVFFQITNCQVCTYFRSFPDKIHYLPAELTVNSSSHDLQYPITKRFLPFEGFMF